MRPEFKLIQNVFENARWTRLERPELIPLQGVFANSYATIGILIVDNVDQVLATWERAQDALRELKSSDPRLRDNDAYLIIVVSHVDTKGPRLNEVLDNTYVCRKLLLEVDGRTIEEALKELPFFAVTASNDGATIETELGTMVQDLPELLLQDLRKASSEAVLERLLQGKYNRGGG